MWIVHPIRTLKRLFNDFLIAVFGTWVGAPQDPPWDQSEWSRHER